MRYTARMFRNPDHHLTPHRAGTLLAIAVAIISGAGLFAAQASRSMEPPAPAAPQLAALEPNDSVPWKRPPGPPRVGLQAGHWLAQDAPEELAAIRDNGAYAAGHAEWKVNLDIARRAAALIEQHGVIVNVLPATVPAEYTADAFVSIHADDSPDRTVSGYKVAQPKRDATGRADWLAMLLADEYAAATGMAADPNVTANMRDYYAFNSQEYEHAVDPMTPSALIETGFLTNARDRRIIVKDPDVAAQAIARAVLRFLELPVDAASTPTPAPHVTP